MVAELEKALLSHRLSSMSRKAQQHYLDCVLWKRKLERIRAECRNLLAKHPADALPVIVKLTGKISLAMASNHAEGIIPTEVADIPPNSHQHEACIYNNEQQDLCPENGEQQEVCSENSKQEVCSERAEPQQGMCSEKDEPQQRVCSEQTNQEVHFQYQDCIDWLAKMRDECTNLLAKHPADALPVIIKLAGEVALAMGDHQTEWITPTEVNSPPNSDQHEVCLENGEEQEVRLGNGEQEPCSIKGEQQEQSSRKQEMCFRGHLLQAWLSLCKSWLAYVGEWGCCSCQNYLLN